SRSAALELLTQLQLNYASGADASLASLAAVEAQIRTGVAAFQPLIKTPEQRALWDDANAKWKDYKIEQERSIAVAQDGLAGDAQKILVGLAKAKFAKAVTAVSKLIDSANEQADAARIAANAAAVGARRTVLALLALAARSVAR